VTKLIPESFRTLDEARGMVINDYQQEVEEQWIKDLKSKYKITVNQDVLSKVKSQIYN
jgi:peptidyl-prolyl cis-trans isomerase SurA